MNLADFTRDLGSGLTRNLPYFRGLGSFYRLFNRAILKAGAQPVVIAKMEDSTFITVDLRTNTEMDAYYRGKYDSKLMAILRTLLNPRFCFLDIGANIGFYTIAIGAFIKSKNAAGHVIAFEPFEGNYIRLTENIKINDLNNYCSELKIGLSDKASDSVITLREDFEHGSQTGNAAIPTQEEFDQGFRQVPIRLERLDQVWPRFGDKYEKIDIIKLDIEGHEDFCLRGGLHIIQTHRPTILMEVNKPYYVARGVDIDEVFLDLFPDFYSIYHEVEGKWQQIDSLNECTTIDNIFIVPREKLNSDSYAIFQE